MESIGPAEATNGGGTPSAQPQTTPQPVSVGQTHLGQSLCVLWCRQAVHRVVCVGFRGWIRTGSALAPHKLWSTKTDDNPSQPPQLPPEHLLTHCRMYVRSHGGSQSHNHKKKSARRPVAWLLGCLVTWLLGCLVAWLFGCLVGRLIVCLLACLLVCLAC